MTKEDFERILRDKLVDIGKLFCEYGGDINGSAVLSLSVITHGKEEENTFLSAVCLDDKDNYLARINEFHNKYWECVYEQ